MATFSNSWSIIPGTNASEISSNPLRENTLALSAFCAFAVGLIVSFTIPYIQNAEYGNLGGKIAFVWMGFSIVSGIYTYFMLPELKNRSLEELDYMFETGISTRKFKGFDAAELLAQKRLEHGTGKPEADVELEHAESQGTKGVEAGTVGHVNHV
ncbi:hypothetical protein NW759_015003 [Fusarium solani]|nr:hypothetical protein NW759_015003 [Fusarium solani]